MSPTGATDMRFNNPPNGSGRFRDAGSPPYRHPSRQSRLDWLGLITLTLAVTPIAASAYPAAPNTWTWQYHTNSTFSPYKISACTDPDGRLRTVFLNKAKVRTFTEAGTPHQVYAGVMQSFRRLPDGAVLDEYAGVADASPNSYTSSLGIGYDASANAIASGPPSCVYSALWKDHAIVERGGFIRLGPGETFGSNMKSTTSNRESLPIAGRPVRIGRSPTMASNMVYAMNSVSGSIQNEALLMDASGDLLITVYQALGVGDATLAIGNFGSYSVPGWSAGRTVTGASIAATADLHDYYAFVTSHATVAGALHSEARLFGMRLTGDTTVSAGLRSLVIGSITNSLVSDTVLAGNNPAFSLYSPKICVASTGEPEWVVWTQPDAAQVHIAKRTAVAGGTATENTRSIANGYAKSAALNSTVIGNGLSSSADLDSLDRLHVCYQETTSQLHLFYAREAANGAFVTVDLPVSCLGPQTMTMGPGDYPYIVFRGEAPLELYSQGSLVVATPAGMQGQYKGDFEDRDHDGRCALLELAQGTSDLAEETSATLTRVTLSPAIVAGTGTTHHFEMGFQLNLNCVRAGSDTTWNLADGADTIVINPAYTGDFNNFGLEYFSVVSEFAIAGRYRYVTVRDSVDYSIFQPKQYYRLQVRRVTP